MRDVNGMKPRQAVAVRLEEMRKLLLIVERDYEKLHAFVDERHETDWDHFGGLSHAVGALESIDRVLKTLLKRL